MTDQKKADLKLVAEAVAQLYHAISDTEVTVAPDKDREFIIVKVNGATYRVNVECENVRAMVRSVVNETVLKI